MFPKDQGRGVTRPYQLRVLAALLVFSYLFWKRIAPEFPQVSQSPQVLQVASNPPPATPASSAPEVIGV
jgi:hypothetical protein